MARLFRSKSSGHIKVMPPPPPSSYYDSDNEEEEEDEEEEDYYEDEVLENEYDDMILRNHSSDIDEVKRERTRSRNGNGNGNQFPILDILVTALRKSLVTCSVETDDVCSMDISSPINVRHVSHVTFDRFNGFLGLPTEFEPEVPTKVPSASVSVFGVSAKSMQCSFDDRGNSVPTILLMMQKRLYSEGGLKAEGIFRINAENSQEEFVRNQLNRGVVPQGIDVHCLAGLIKAWLRELPTGVLDSLTPEQVMCCNTEEDCTQLVKLLPPVEAGILDWAITLMADVVQYEMYNKMNARNIAMVFAPNMTQMADPLTALIHAVQVMNLLKTLILKILRERDESDATQSQSSCLDSPNHETYMTSSNSKSGKSAKQPSNVEPTSNDKICTNSDRIDPKPCEKFQTFEEKRDEEEEYHSASGTSTPNRYETGGLQREGYESSDWLNLRKGVRKLCRHPVFQLSKPIKKTRTFGVVSCKY